jgi:hypothetical protein
MTTMDGQHHQITLTSMVRLNVFLGLKTTTMNADADDDDGWLAQGPQTMQLHCRGI